MNAYVGFSSTDIHLNRIENLLIEEQAFVYQRLSTHEQRKRNLWSLEMQEALIAQAKADGYGDDQIVVERRDLGISGTKGEETDRAWRR